jgi:hypothetical protein
MRTVKTTLITIFFIIAIVISMVDTVRLTQEKNELLNQNVEFYRLYLLSEFKNEILLRELYKVKRENDIFKKEHSKMYVFQETEQWNLSKK